MIVAKWLLCRFWLHLQLKPTVCLEWKHCHFLVRVKFSLKKCGNKTLIYGLNSCQHVFWHRWVWVAWDTGWLDWSKGVSFGSTRAPQDCACVYDNITAVIVKFMNVYLTYRSSPWRQYKLGFIGYILYTMTVNLDQGCECACMCVSVSVCVLHMCGCVKGMEGHSTQRQLFNH